MKIRLLFIAIAFSLPIIILAIIAYVSIPDKENIAPEPAKPSLPLIDASKAPELYHIPDNLEEAKEWTKKRLAYFQSLSQDEWDKKRREIDYRMPPDTISGAIARTEWRLNDLNQMSEDEWKLERERLVNRNEILMQRLQEKKAQKDR